MKNKLLKQFVIRKNNAEKIWAISLGSIIFCAAVIFLIITSWFSIDRALSDWFGKAMLDTSGAWNKIVRGWATYFDFEPYKFPYIFVSVLVIVILEVFWSKFIKRYPNNWLSKRKHFMAVVDILLGGLVLVWVIVQQAKTYFGGWDFVQNFYIWTMSGKDILLPACIISCMVMSATQVILILYVHNVLAKRDNFEKGGYWELAFLTGAFFLIVNFYYVNGLKGVFSRPYEVNLRWKDWTDKLKEIYPSDQYPYLSSYEKTKVYWGYVTSSKDSLYLNYPSDMSFPWYKINNRPEISGVKLIYNDAFPSGHMNCSLLIPATLFVLFRNPRNEKEHIYAAVSVALSVWYVINMVLILEYSWSHWMSDMAFSLVTMPIMYIGLIAVWDGIENIVMKVSNNFSSKFKK